MSRKIAYFITAHGYGHAVRSSYLISELGRFVEITIVTDIPRSFFDEELTVPFGYRQASFDCGCVQKDAVTIDSTATVHEYARISLENDQHLAEEVRWVVSQEFDLIISDVVPFAGVIGSNADIPVISVSNFWWDDIYRDFPDSDGKRWLLNRVEGEMSCFSHHVFLNPSMKRWENDNNVLKGVNLLREARNRGEELRTCLGIANSKNIALIYTGNYGMESIDWSKLTMMKNWHFIGLYPLKNAPHNFTQIDKSQFTMQEFNASADVVISKLGYGTVTESLASGTPLLYMPRVGFSEYPVLETYIKRFGHVSFITEAEFSKVEWVNEINELHRGGKRGIRLSSDAKTISDWILAIPLT